MRHVAIPRPLLLVIGWVSVVLGVVGIVVPVLPTTVFLLIAAWCFLRSSPRAHGWLIEHRVLGPYVRDYLSGHGMPLRAKVIAIGAMWTACITSAWLFVPNPYGKGALLLAAAVGSAFVLRVPTRTAVPENAVVGMLADAGRESLAPDEGSAALHRSVPTTRRTAVPEKQTIAVVGATGAQGGGLVKAILNRRTGPFDARALTRDIDSEKARDLVSRGAEVFPVDLDDSLSVKRAFDGAYGAYCVTFFWAHMSPSKETQHGRTMAEAARHAGIEHAIWSTFEDTRQWVPLDDDRMPTLQDNYKVPHFDAKADANSAFTELGVPTTFLLTSYYWENLLHPGMGPKRDGNGTLVLTMPMGDQKLAGISSEDIGKCAYGIFQRRDKYVGKTVGIAAEHLTGAQMAAALSDALGEEVRYDAVSADAYRASGFPGADEMGNMFQFYRDFAADYCAARDPEVAHCLNPEIQTFEQWLARNKTRFPRD